MMGQAGPVGMGMGMGMGPMGPGAMVPGGYGMGGVGGPGAMNMGMGVAGATGPVGMSMVNGGAGPRRMGGGGTFGHGRMGLSSVDPRLQYLMGDMGHVSDPTELNPR